MFIICAALSTIIIIVYLCSVYIARWAIRTDFGRMLAAVYLDDRDLKNEFSKLSKEEVLSEIVILHCKLHDAMKDEKFSLVQTINTRIFFAMCRFTDIIADENLKNENTTRI
jgi:hypothetical protein